MSRESIDRERIAAVGALLYRRGLSPGSGGNISVRLADGWLMTPTNTALGELDPASLSKVSLDGDIFSGDPPTKEMILHLALYRHRPKAGAIVDLHATHAAAVSCLDGLDPGDCIPPLTAYHVMKVGRLPLIPCHPPGERCSRRSHRCTRGLGTCARARQSRTPREWFVARSRCDSR
ncbi:aldolase [Mycolicibacterium mageritense DSM 44476 = CIP 104973]|uniref:L-fuculose phosphate aldolase n=1 Tax=Mycolicibacterium mageritense TaxID=53462 RepID=A0AAI8TUX7_MYCME|nr:class II aldolase/adducin family protein [Mycolicibacterium mageritense]MCC9181804.1 class II aldolase/adducin family protein [Mycolicibacterium mageritense]BBX34315.1 hypothetical protein MMAGJ_35970 [Mycolicibacterium mageritense]BDY29296.1 L-fuculose phosphate aldolase [Mycolicibacterium mageritense]CDO21164.1 L-fuculose phosphate aldolase [Mycolicibacterium mageritense DSM 44476 = CIP 104973]